MKPQNNEWREQFDKEFSEKVFESLQTAYLRDLRLFRNDIKCFIKSLLLKKQEEYEKNIGMLRQWLNEDRIDDPKKMVTNEELKKWLDLIK